VDRISEEYLASIIQLTERLGPLLDRFIVEYDRIKNTPALKRETTAVAYTVRTMQHQIRTFINQIVGVWDGYDDPYHFVSKVTNTTLSIVGALISRFFANYIGLVDLVYNATGKDTLPITKTLRRLQVVVSTIYQTVYYGNTINPGHLHEGKKKFTYKQPRMLGNPNLKVVSQIGEILTSTNALL
jgi:hypothetical protein